MTAATKNDLQVLAPKPVDVVIGDADPRTFVQKPLSLRGTAALVVALSDELQKATNSPALANLLNTDLANMDGAAMAPAMIQVLASIPTALPRVITVILTGSDEDTETMDFVDENCRLPQAMRIFRTFIEQNEPEELVENFMVLRSTLGDALSKAKAKAAVTTS